MIINTTCFFISSCVLDSSELVLFMVLIPLFVNLQGHLKFCTFLFCCVNAHWYNHPLQLWVKLWRPCFIGVQVVCVCSFTMPVALSMAEICSSYPTSSGLYYWSAKLAGPQWAPFASWITGWYCSQLIFFPLFLHQAYFVLPI